MRPRVPKVGEVNWGTTLGEALQFLFRAVITLAVAVLALAVALIVLTVKVL